MFKVCTAQEMRNIDCKASEALGIPGVVLMENAGMRCVEELLKKFKSVKNLKIGIFCGKGNNGGDGFVIARQLDRLGALVDVFCVCGNEFSDDAKINFDILKNTGCTVMGNIEYPEYEIPMYDIVIDAIFGTGIKGEIKESIAEVIESLNRNSKFIMSVDVPSGLNSDTGEVQNACIKADMTVTFAAYKKGLLLYPGADYCGEVLCVDICIPKELTDDSDINVLDREFVKSVFPKRFNNSQKGDYGKVLIVGGSEGMSGAAVLAAEAALICGSGLVTVAACEEINGVLETKTTEVMTVPLKSKDGHLSDECIPKLLGILPQYDAVLFGPGLGRSEDIGEILRSVVRNCEVPLIIDADGLYALAKNPDVISECNCSLILTPHEMEMSRLLGLDIDFVLNDRLGVSKEYAEDSCVTLILKGHHTVVTSLEGVQYINIRGNSGMATAGSGDTLAGLCVSLAARCDTEENAAAAAVFIHSVAGDMAALKYGEDGVSALRIQEFISEAVKEVLR